MAEPYNDVCSSSSEEESKLTKAVLILEEIEENLYSANYVWCSELRQVFGGQVVGQALVAAGHTVPSHHEVHSMHGYFLLRGDDHLPIVYQVENTRDSKNFSDRIVKAKQNDEIIFMCMVSFQKLELPLTSVTHQYCMPDVVPPETLPLYEDLMLESIRTGNMTPHQRIWKDIISVAELSFHVKPIEISSLGFFCSPEPKPPKVQFWIKLKGTIPDSKEHMHRCVAAFMSDVLFVGTSRLAVDRRKFMMVMGTSLDHSLWFHNNFRADEWLLYECESPCYVGSRTLVLGRLWKRDGTLAVSVAQEGLHRYTSLL